MKNVLWVGDAGCPSGFGRATHEILDVVHHHYHTTVLGINYRGDPHGYPYDIYAAAVDGDAFGVLRIVWMCSRIKIETGAYPDVIVLQNDGWNLQEYLKQLRRYKELAHIKVVAVVAVDGKNFQAEWLRGIDLAIFWTEFALKEAQASGYIGPACVIPLGVDLDNYYPMDQTLARFNLFSSVGAKAGSVLDQAFIVGNVNRNQPRKRWDLTVEYFAEWIKSFDVHDAYLYLHTAPTGDMGMDVQQLAKYYGVLNRLALFSPPTHYGISEAAMRDTYNSFNVQISTTQGEGFGLTTFEGMACGVSQILPAWSALGELCAGAALMVPCTSTAVGPPYVNVIGGVADKARFVKALDDMYRSADVRDSYGQSGLTRVKESRFRWSNIGQRYVEALDSLFAITEGVRIDHGRSEEVCAE